MPSNPAMARTSRGSGRANVQRAGSTLRSRRIRASTSGVSCSGSRLISVTPRRARSSALRLCSIALPLSTIKGQTNLHDV